MIVFLLTIVAALAALAGGYTAIYNRDRLHVAISLTSGLVLGLVAFDLLPEIFEGAKNSGLDPAWPMVLFAGGFLFFHVIEKLILVHHDAESEYGPHTHPKLGVARAVALAGHSFLDGLSIGVGFQVSTAVGLAVALAVIGHRFADGLDTASFMLLHRNKLSHIKKFLAIVVIMPILGGLGSLLVSFSESILTMYLGFFAGILMYIAASNILPQAHAKNASSKSIMFTVLGVVLMFVITRLTLV
jgi:ZIP family zinc transporter